MSDKASCTAFVRRAWTQILLVSLIATLSRGTLNALNAVGGLGTGDVRTATMVNLLSSVSFTFLSWSSGGIVNVLGYRASCSIGSATTTVTLTMLMLFTMFHMVPPWSVWTAATFDGLGSGVLWTAAGTMLIKYPDDTKKGFASTVLFAIYSCGAALGGLLSFTLNMNANESTTRARLKDAMDSHIPPSAEDNIPLIPIGNSGLKPASYSVMISLAVVALCLTVFIVREDKVTDSRGRKLELDVDSPKTSEGGLENVSSACRSRESSRVSLAAMASSQSNFRLFSPGPGAILRSDESKMSMGAPLGPLSSSAVVMRSMSKVVVESAHQQLRQLVITVQERSVQFLIIYSFASLFHQTYLFNGINYKAFNVRTRGLNCCMYWVGRIPAGFVHGHLVDDIRHSTRTRALHGLTLLMAYVAICQCLAVIFWAAVPSGVFDVIVDPANTALAFLSFFLYGGLDTISQSFVLWIFSVLGRRHPSRVPHYVAVFRCFQGLGTSLAWALDLNSFTTYQTQFLVCAVCWLLALPGLSWVIYSLPHSDASPPPAVTLKLGAAVISNLSSPPIEDSTQPSSEANDPSEHGLALQAPLSEHSLDKEIVSV